MMSFNLPSFELVCDRGGLGSGMELANEQSGEKIMRGGIPPKLDINTLMG